MITFSWFIIKSSNKTNEGMVLNQKVKVMNNTLKQIRNALGYGGVYLGGQVAGGLGVGVMVSYYMALKYRRPDIMKDPEMVALYKDTVMNSLGLLVCVAAVATLVMLFLIFKLRHKKMSESINAVKVSPKKIALGAAIGIVSMFALCGILEVLPLSDSIVSSYNEASEGLFTQNVVLAILGNAIAAPVVEEVIFRGLIFDRLRKGMPVVPAMIISSILFGLAHGQILWICYASVLGMVLCYVFYKTGSIYTSIAMHLALNLTSTVFSYIGVVASSTVVIVLGGIGIVALVALLALLNKTSKEETSDVEVSVVKV